MAINRNVVVKDDGGSAKKKTAVIDTQGTGGRETDYGSSGREHGVSSGSFTPSLNKDGGEQKYNNFDKTGGEQKTPNTTSGGGGGGGGGSSAIQASAPNYDTSVPSVFGSTVDPELQAQYQNAMAALEQMKGKAPTYGSQYDAQIQSLYNEIIGRGPFKYDQKTDPLYQQYVQDYTTQGKMAMRDTMGRAAGLTGGYGSSYAQAVGQQQYDQYLQKMADILPDTYGMALNAYNAEGDQLNQKLATTTDLEKSDYNRYLDALQQHNIDVQRAQTDADTWYDRMVAAEKQAYNRQLDQYDMQKDAYNRLVQLISMGYSPSKAEYNAAGLSEAQGQALRGAYMPQPSSSGGGGGSGSTASADAAFEQALLSALGGKSGGMTKNTGTSKTNTQTQAAAQAAAKVADAVNKLKIAMK